MIVKDTDTGKMIRTRNPLGEEELEAAHKNRERLKQYHRPRPVIDIDDKKKSFARRYYQRQRR